MIYVFDLDGTICFRGRPVTEKILKTFEELHLKGHEIIFASARPIRDMLPVLDKKFHSYTMIGGNGSLISKNGKLIHSTSFTNIEFETLRSLLVEYNSTYLIDGDWDYTYTGSKDHPILNNLDPSGLAKNVDIDEHTTIVKTLVLTSDNMEELLKKIDSIGVVVHKHSNENVLDISPKNIDKWNALSKLGIKKGDYIAFGNDTNDISMFINASYSIMIGSHEELSNYASEFIQLDDDTEDNIIGKLNQISQAMS